MNVLAEVQDYKIARFAIEKYLPQRQALFLTYEGGVYILGGANEKLSLTPRRRMIT